MDRCIPDARLMAASICERARMARGERADRKFGRGRVVATPRTYRGREGPPTALRDAVSTALRAGEDPDVAAQLANQAVDGPVAVGEHNVVRGAPEPLDVPLWIS
jgi:hypothetical protein